jgi:hypothetical protein
MNEPGNNYIRNLYRKLKRKSLDFNENRKSPDQFKHLLKFQVRTIFNIRLGLSPCSSTGTKNLEIFCNDFMKMSTKVILFKLSTG